MKKKKYVLPFRKRKMYQQTNISPVDARNRVFFPPSKNNQNFPTNITTTQESIPKREILTHSHQKLKRKQSFGSNEEIPMQNRVHNSISPTSPNHTMFEPQQKEYSHTSHSSYDKPKAKSVKRYLLTKKFHQTHENTQRRDFKQDSKVYPQNFSGSKNAMSSQMDMLRPNYSQVIPLSNNYPSNKSNIQSFISNDIGNYNKPVARRKKKKPKKQSSAISNTSANAEVVQQSKTIEQQSSNDGRRKKSRTYQKRRKTKKKKRKVKEEEETPVTVDETLYCICKTLYNAKRWYVACDKCDGWFHGDCMGFENEIDSLYINKFFCDECIKKDPKLEVSFKKRTGLKREKDKKIDDDYVQKLGEMQQKKKRKLFQNSSVGDAPIEEVIKVKKKKVEKKKKIVIKCYCNEQKPLSKEITDCIVQCYVCKYWYHKECLGCIDKETKIEKFKCKFCVFEENSKRKLMEGDKGKKRKHRGRERKKKRIFSNSKMKTVEISEAIVHFSSSDDNKMEDDVFV